MAIYLLSKRLDPLFMLFIGASATWVRIRRENPNETPAETFETLRRRMGKVDWRGYAKRAVPGLADDDAKWRQFGKAEPPNSRRRPELGDL
ncbi:MAG: hypothetical protein M1828_003136 [Chrysothrix sp. TS-e1954]|nr:MAG: hypothetical protein M1828_003136 [Chrysothrix sp. TS-e1954]